VRKRVGPEGPGIVELSIHEDVHLNAILGPEGIGVDVRTVVVLALQAEVLHIACPEGADTEGPLTLEDVVPNPGHAVFPSNSTSSGPRKEITAVDWDADLHHNSSILEGWGTIPASMVLVYQAPEGGTQKI
jgi:hypothetical protein